jgi:hypothetical protein
LQKAGPPFHEVRIIRASWRRPVGQLKTASIAAAKQLNRRARDSLYDLGVVAVGTFKVAPSLIPSFIEIRESEAGGIRMKRIGAAY